MVEAKLEEYPELSMCSYNAWGLLGFLEPPRHGSIPLQFFFSCKYWPDPEDCQKWGAAACSVQRT